MNNIKSKKEGRIFSLCGIVIFAPSAYANHHMPITEDPNFLALVTFGFFLLLFLVLKGRKK